MRSPSEVRVGMVLTTLNMFPIITSMMLFAPCQCLLPLCSSPFVCLWALNTHPDQGGMKGAWEGGDS